jgi:hypothetical protein
VRKTFTSVGGALALHHDNRQAVLAGAPGNNIWAQAAIHCIIENILDIAVATSCTHSPSWPKRLNIIVISLLHL